MTTKKKVKRVRKWRAFIHKQPNGQPIRYDDGRIVVEKSSRCSTYEDCVVVPIEIREVRR